MGEGEGQSLGETGKGEEAKLMSEEGRSATQIVVRSFLPFLPPWLQSALAVFDKTLDMRPSTIVEGRISEMVEAWRRELRRPLVKLYEPQFLDAQSFTQLLILTLEATVRDRLSEKRQMYGRLLARADTPEWASRAGRVEEALTALIPVLEADLRVLKPIMAQVQAVRARGIVEESEFMEATSVVVSKLQEVHLSDLTRMGVRTYITRLERLGLLLRTPASLLRGSISRLTCLRN